MFIFQYDEGPVLKKITMFLCSTLYLHSKFNVHNVASMLIWCCPTSQYNINLKTALKYLLGFQYKLLRFEKFKTTLVHKYIHENCKHEKRKRFDNRYQKIFLKVSLQKLITKLRTKRNSYYLFYTAASLSASFIVILKYSPKLSFSEYDECSLSSWKLHFSKTFLVQIFLSFLPVHCQDLQK